MRKSIVGAVVLAATVLAGCSSASDSGEDAIRFAVTDLQGMEELQREFGAFKDTFEEYSGRDLEFFAVTDRTAAAAALENNDVDVVFTGPAEYVVFHERTNAEPIIAIERPGYSSCIYTTNDSGITNLEELKGEKIAMTDVGSTSGHLGPAQILKEAGLDPQNDVEILMIGDSVHQALKRGDVAAVGVGCHDYDEFMAEEPNPDDFPVIKRGEDLPPDVLMANEALDQETRDLVKSTFEDHWDELLPAMLEGKDNGKYQDAKLVQVDDSSYDIVRSMYSAIGVDDFSEFVG